MRHKMCGIYTKRRFQKKIPVWYYVPSFSQTGLYIVITLSWLEIKSCTLPKKLTYN